MYTYIIGNIMKVNCPVVSRLPVEWQGLFKQLGSSVERGNSWYIEETSSLYGSRPTWHKLLHSLTRCEPSIEDSKLTFKPRLLLLPDKLQTELMKFLQDQSYIIPDMYIKQFVLGLIGYVQVDSSIHQKLNTLFRETKFSDDLLKDAAQKLVLQLGDDLQEKQDSQVETAVLPGYQDNVIILDDSDEEETREPASKRLRLEGNTENEKLVTNETEAVAIEIDENELVKTDEVKVEDCCSEVLEGIICRLKEIWQNCIADSKIEGLNAVSKLSLKEIEVFCKMMDFDSMSDDSIELVCQHLCLVSDSLSYSSAVCILTFVLGKTIMQLSQKASRKLSGAVTLVSQKFPKQTVDSVLLPCTLQREIPAVQSEILCKMIKECLNAATKEYFIKKLMQNSFVLNENKIPVLQTVIDSNCDMTGDTLSSLLNCLNEASVQMAKNLKFGKLLLAVINKHSTLFDRNLKNQCEIILEKHNTFLKKSIQNVLNKIKVV